MNKVLLLHAPTDAARAHKVTASLEALGYSVRAEVCGALGPRRRRQIADAARTTANVLLLWSRAATPSLRAAAKAARRSGRLSCARLDASLPPARLATCAIGLPAGRAQGAALQRLFDPPAMAGAKQRAPSPRKPARGNLGRFAALAVVVLALAAGWTAYSTNTDVAARVNGLLNTAQAMAHSIKR
jgi:hypothetical protein